MRKCMFVLIPMLAVPVQTRAHEMAQCRISHEQRRTLDVLRSMTQAHGLFQMQKPTMKIKKHSISVNILFPLHQQDSNPLKAQARDSLSLSIAFGSKRFRVSCPVCPQLLSGLSKGALGVADACSNNILQSPARRGDGYSIRLPPLVLLSRGNIDSRR